LSIFYWTVLNDMPNIQLNRPFITFEKMQNEPFVYINRPIVMNSKNIGFTLVEMIITVAIAAILVVVAIPSFSQFTLSARIRTQTNSLITDIAVARNSATTRPARVIICPSSTGLACNAADWSSGRLMYWEAQPFGGGPVAGAAGNILRYTEALPVTIQTFAPTTAPNPLIFNSFGQPIDVFGAPLSASVAMPLVFTLCDVEKKVRGRQVFINASGQSSTVPYTCP
jgi:prepilin-type N-terminal cleavage/methylation domain-containing protein